jgi:predicted GIY-YIG superfamily endonuclease
MTSDCQNLAKYTGVMACASARAAEHQSAAEHNAAAEHHAAADENNGFLACVGVMAQKGSF